MNKIKKENLIDIILSNKLYCDIRGNIYHPDYEQHLSHYTGSWQFPDEYADLMLFFDNRPIKTFLNIGTYNGIAFNILASYLYKMYQTKSITIDPINHNPYKNYLFEYNNYTSSNYVGKSFDLVFIDGDHSYMGVKTDYENVGRFAKYCVFHDIDDDFIRNDINLQGGVPRFWNEIKHTKQHTEINSAKKYLKTMGIGILYE